MRNLRKIFYLLIAIAVLPCFFSINAWTKNSNKFQGILPKNISPVMQIERFAASAEILKNFKSIKELKAEPDENGLVENIFAVSLSQLTPSQMIRYLSLLENYQKGAFRIKKMQVKPAAISPNSYDLNFEVMSYSPLYDARDSSIDPKKWQSTLNKEYLSKTAIMKILFSPKSLAGNFPLILKSLILEQENIKVTAGGAGYELADQIKTDLQKLIPSKNVILDNVKRGKDERIYFFIHSENQ
jgi:hypothetical protein